MSRQDCQTADRFILPRRCVPIGLVLLLAASFAIAQDRDDLVIADFEGENYGAWTATGQAFGPGPARGTLPGQMNVGGFQGARLANSFHGGDSSTGTLTSPPFVIRRPYLNFLIGGGKYPGRTAMELIIAGAVVRSATGPNDRPGGTEHLDWASWDVTEFGGKSAVLRIVDQHQGGWGHINVDQIVQSHRRQGVEPASRELLVNARYLHLPVQRDAPVRRLKIVASDRTIREFDIRLAEERVDFLVFDDVASFRGKPLKIETVLPYESKSLQKIAQAEELPGAGALYRETDRPQFHFTSRRGWLNDPNGLLWHEGEYHLFYQHNPYGWDWGNMHWGHAVSPDLVHWTELPIALSPREYGDWCFSGSGVVDRKNTSGFGSDRSPPLVVAYTSTGRGECIAYSNDRGRTWAEYAKNPVIRHQGRDPRLFYHEPTGRWVMAVYDEADDKQAIAFHSSPDLKEWTAESRIEGFYECPDLFELPVSGADGQSRWVLSGADGAYRLGRFDGHQFTPDTAKLRTWYGDFYAAQTFSDTPDRRRIQIGWGRGVDFPAMPFNQQMTIPCELTLGETDEGIRMFARPVAEVASLRTKRHSWRDLGAVGLDRDPLAAVTGDLLQIRAEAEVGPAGKLTLLVRGVPVIYDAGRNTLSCGQHSAPLAPSQGKIQLQILVDRGSIEVFGNDGQVAISLGVIPAKEARSLSASALGENPRIRLLEVDELTSSWR